MQNSFALQLSNIELAYDDVTALKGVSFDLAEGHILCLLGASGCGKTTALRSIAGLEAPQRGTIEIASRMVSGPGIFIPPEQRDVGLLFQDFALFPHLTVAENIAFGIRQKRSTEITARVTELLKRVHIEHLQKAYPHKLSGGEQQRVALARALAPRPKILLLDEPFSNLDTRLRQQVRDETLHILKDLGTSVLMVTHDPEEALFMGDRIALMRDGKILQLGDPTDLYCRPIDVFVAEFFGEVNHIPSRVENGTVPTPFGAIAANGIMDNTEVILVVRSEAMLIRTHPNGNEPPHAVVEAAHMLGRSNLIHMHTHPATGFELHIHARTRGGDLPVAGVPVWIDLDRSQVFIFPKK